MLKLILLMEIVLFVFREDHQQSLYQSMVSIMTNILEEKVDQPLLDVILRNLLKKGKVFVVEYFDASVFAVS